MLKRLFDLTVLLVTAPLYLPMLALVALGTFIAHGRPVLFKQARAGMHGRVFRLYKFRTMTNERGPDGELLPDHVRLTRFGKFLRGSSLDELPSILNLLRGDIALVGPRPLLTQYLPLYSSDQARRHEVKPGITGWAQVKGRNNLSWEEKFALDVWYVDNRSIWLDLKILAFTVVNVVRGEGVAQDGHVTMPVFTGSKREL